MSETFHAIANLLAEGLAVLFALVALLHLAAPRFLRAAYRRWDYAHSFLYVVGAVAALVALFLALPLLRVWGGILGGMMLAAATVALLNRERYLCAVPVMLLLAALAPAMA